ncbi:hypothetical protein RYX36_002541, partial [Vicia faba]
LPPLSLLHEDFIHYPFITAEVKTMAVSLSSLTSSLYSLYFSSNISRKPTTLSLPRTFSFYHSSKLPSLTVSTTSLAPSIESETADLKTYHSYLRLRVRNDSLIGRAQIGVEAARFGLGGGEHAATLTKREIGEEFNTRNEFNASKFVGYNHGRRTLELLKIDTLWASMRINWYGFFGKKFKDLFGNIFEPELSGLVYLKDPRDHGFPYSLTEEFTSVYKMHALLPEEIVLRKLKPATGKNKSLPIQEK